MHRRTFISASIKASSAGLLSTSVRLTSPTNGNRISGSARSDIARDIIRLRRLDDTVSGNDLLALYKPVAQRLHEMLERQTYTDVTRHELITLYSEHLQQTGWAAFDSGNHSEATTHYQDSFEAARSIGDRELAANALAFQAYQQVMTGRDGTSLTDQSVKLASKKGRPGVQALLYQRGAWSYAIAGDAEQTGELLSLAEQAIEADRGDSPDWAS